MVAGVHATVAQTTLNIAPAGNQALLFWPSSVTNWILQSTTNLATPNWVTASNAVLVTVSNAVPVTAFSLTNTMASSFFRLLQNTNTPITTADGMALVPAGSFIMGDTLDGEKDAIPISVTVSSFYMDTNLVSFGQWELIYIWATNNGYIFTNTGVSKATNYPIETVDWYDTLKWCNARSQQAGLDPVYYTDANFTQVYTNGETTNVFANWSANGYRLPTEAEWEKAARGGLSGLRFPWGDAISESQANYYGDTGDFGYDLGPTGYNSLGHTGETPYTTPVGSFVRNGYGLYDMAGNLWEWCWDWYGVPYGQPTANNPTGPTTGIGRVLRGDSWHNFAEYARCAYRDPSDSTATATGIPTQASYYVGFRCVRGL
jgi:formylglycine-generating enzyme